MSRIDNEIFTIDEADDSSDDDAAVAKVELCCLGLENTECQDHYARYQSHC